MPGANGKGFLLTDPERCTSVGFEIPFDPSLSSIRLSVPKLLGSVPEVVNAERVEIANQRLAERGIQFDYVNVDHGGNIAVVMVFMVNQELIGISFRSAPLLA